jgi:cobalt-zinc-cadmium efflux system outer membrane protein
MKKLCLALAIFTVLSSVARAQQQKDTLPLTLADAETVFQQKNLLLLAQHYNVNASRALIIQARLWSNPGFNYSQGAYNPTAKKWFSFDRENGETAFGLDQLILLAGKIHKQVKIAETNALLAEYNLFDLLRTLKFTLRSDFFSIYYLQQTAAVYNEEINSLKTIVTVFEQQSSKGYIAQTEVVRVKAQLYSLQSEYNDLVNQINDKQSELRLLLQAQPSVYVSPQADTTAVKAASPMTYSLQTMLDSAYLNRTDLMIAKANLTLSEQNYTFQKALAVPDITVGTSFDKNGSYVHNFNAASLGFNIPIFNRNQGNIKSAKSLISYNNTLLQSTQKTLEEQVSRALQKAIDADRLYQGIDPGFAGQFSKLSKAVLDNYTKRNIGLLDFLTFYDSYKQNIIQLNNILLNKAGSLENLNFLTGTNFFNK